MALSTNEDIISLCNRITAFCIRLNKRLDAADRQAYMEWQLPTHNQYVVAPSGQQDRASFYQPDRYPPQPDPDPPYAPPAYTNHAEHPLDWQHLQPPDAAPPYGMTHQFGHQYWHTPSQPSELRSLQQHTYWEQHHQHQKPVLDQPPPQHWPSYWHPPSQHRSAVPLPAAPPPAAISLPRNTDIRYGSVELFHKDIDESVQSRQIHYDDIVFDRLLNRDQHVEDDVLLNVEEVSHIANEIHLDPETKDAIHFSVEGSFNLSNVEASKELIVTESKVGESIAKIEKHFVTNKKDNGEDTSSNVVIPDGGDDAIISHCSTTLDTDARLIPPRDDTSCLGILGHVAKPLVLALNHKHVLRAKEVEGVSEVLQANKSVIYQSSIEPRSKTPRQKTALSTPTQSGPAILRIKAANEVGPLKQIFGTRWSARFAEKSAKFLQGVTWFLKKDLVIDDVQNFKRNWEESLDKALEDDVDVGYVRQPLDDETWFRASETDYPSDVVQGKGHGSIPSTQSIFHPWQPEHHPPRTSLQSGRTQHPPLETLPAAAPPYTAESRYVNNISVSPTLVPNVVAPVHDQPVLIRVQKTHVSEQSRPFANEAVFGEVCNPPTNGDVPVSKEEEVHVSRVVDEDQDDTESVVETPAIRENTLEESYAPMVMHLKVMATTLLPLPAAVFVLVIKGKGKKVMEGVRSLIKGGATPQFTTIDDGWKSVDMDPTNSERACVTYCISDTPGCITKHSPQYKILMVGRNLGGTATSFLFSPFESWLVAEHLRKSFEQQWLSLAFSKAIFLGNSLVAMEAGFLRNMWFDVEASRELIVKEVDNGFGRKRFDKMWKYADTIGNQSKVCANIAAVETRQIIMKTFLAILSSPRVVMLQLLVVVQQCWMPMLG